MLYKLKLEVNNEVHKTEGKTILECLEKLEKQRYYKTNSYLYMTKGKKTVQAQYNPFRTKRLFEGAKMIKIAVAKNLSILLGEKI